MAETKSGRGATDGWRRDVALFRYALIREPADTRLSSAERGRLVRALAAVEHVGPDGERIRVGRSTIDDWIRAWRAAGFDALLPAPRFVTPRTPRGLTPSSRDLRLRDRSCRSS